MIAPILRVLHVEDEPNKARAVGRIARIAATLLGVELALVHVGSVAEAYSVGGGASSRFDAVISDWCLPLSKGEGPSGRGGVAVVAWAVLRGLPVAVISGSDRPDVFPTSAACRWIDAGEWRDGLDWLFRVALHNAIREAERTNQCGSY